MNAYEYMFTYHIAQGQKIIRTEYEKDRENPMNQKQVQLLDILSNALFKSNNLSKSVDISDTEALMAEASAQAILPLVIHYISYPDRERTQNTTSDIRKQVNSQVAKNLTVFYEHTELHELLTSHNIPYVTLKGCASASYYNDPILRTMGDVDFLINSADFSRGATLLEGIGFEKATDDADEG